MKKNFTILLLALLLTLATTTLVSASVFPDGSSLTIDDPYNGIMPIAVNQSEIKFAIRSSYTNDYQLLTSFVSFPSLSNQSTLPPYLFTYNDFSSRDLYNYFFIQLGNTVSSSCYGTLAIQFEFPQNDPTYLTRRVYLSYNAPSWTMLNSVIDYPSTLLPDFGGSDTLMQTYFVPYFVVGQPGMLLPVFSCYGIKRLNARLYTNGVYPDYSFLYSLSPVSVNAKPVYFNSVQIFYNSSSYGSFNGGCFGGANSFRILNDYIPPAGSSYSLPLFLVGNSNVDPTVSFIGSHGSCSASLSCSPISTIVSTGDLNVTPYKATLNLTFDGVTSISDLVMHLGVSFSLYGGTLVHQSFADYLLYNPDGTQSQSSLEALKQAIQTADANNQSAVEDAQQIIDSNQRALASQLADQHSESMSQAALQHSEAMSQESSLAGEIMNGYTVESSAEEAYSSLSDHVEEWFSQEEVLQSQIDAMQASTAGVFETLNFSELSQGFVLVQSWIQSLFENSGNFQGVFSLSVTMVLVSLLFGATKLFTHRQQSGGGD